MEHSSIDIEFASQNFTLKGILHLPEIENPPLVIGSHGLEGTKDSAKQIVLSETLIKHGIAFFRFDHRGCGQSQGDFLVDTSLEKRTVDFLNAADHVLKLGLTDRRLGLFGSSLGGSVCINAWKKLKNSNIELVGAVLCSPPVQSITIKNIPTNATESRPALPLSFFADNLLFDLTEKTKDLSNTLVFHGDADHVVPVSNGYLIHQNTKEHKKLIIHKNGDHQMTSVEDQAEFKKEATIWFSKCFSIKMLP